MSPFSDRFKGMPGGSQHKTEVDKLLVELKQLGIQDDYLSEHPGGVSICSAGTSAPARLERGWLKLAAWN